MKQIRTLSNKGVWLVQVRYHWYSMLVILNERIKAAQGGSYKYPRFGLVSVLDLQGLSLKSLGA